MTTPECRWDCDVDINQNSLRRYELCVDPALCGETQFNLKPGNKNEKKIKRTLKANSVCLMNFFFDENVEIAEFALKAESPF